MFRRALPAAWLILLLTTPIRAQVPLMETLVTGLQQPVLLTHARDGSERKFIVEQSGRVLVLQPGATSTTVFLDIRVRVLSGGERGLLGLAFHPQYSANGRFYVNYTRQTDGDTVISEFRVSDNDVNVADFLSEVVLLVIPQPFSNHNGGMIAFGPDNYLYIATGDGGSGNDPDNRAQNIEDLLGKILRIDVNHPASPTVRYSSPASNPFSGAAAGRDEIFAVGLRNPWRFSFDRLSGQLLAGDVGQGSREEIDVITSGGNYGWRVFEGTRCTGLGPASCASLTSIPPIVEYNTGEQGRCAVTGGYVYRGSRRSLPYGSYVFGDYCSGEIFLLSEGVMSLLLDSTLNISSFGEDEAGEIYIVNHGGTISRLTSTTSAPVAQWSFSIPENGGLFLPSKGSGQSLVSGYARIFAAAGDNLPDGLAILQWHQQGVLVSELATPATPLTQFGRIFASRSGAERTGVAMTNVNPFAVDVDFHFTSAAGRDFGHGIVRIPANGQVAAFLDEHPFNGGSTIEGTFTFRTSRPVAVMAIQSVTNGRSDFLMSSLPIVPINARPLTGSVFPHWVLGAGWAPEFLLVNPGDVLLIGRIELTDSSGGSIETLNYFIPPRSSRRLKTSTESDVLKTGAARVVPTAGPLPSAVVFYRYSTEIGPVVETIDPAIAPAFSFRGYGEISTEARTGLAVANTSPQSAVVQVELRNLDGTLRDTGSVTLPAFNQKAFFLDEAPGIDSASPFQGIVRVSSVVPIAVTFVRTRVNQRGDFLVASTPPDNLSQTPLGSALLFPLFSLGGGADMEFVLINSQDVGSTEGTMYFFARDGSPFPMSVP